MLFISNRIDSSNSDYSITTEHVTDPDKYVVYSCSTPSDTLRSFDYAFYLVSVLYFQFKLHFSRANIIMVIINQPLTALAWERLGFKSFIILIGNRSEWEEHLVLAHVLDYLSQRNATYIFLNAPHAQRVTVSQIVRYISNLNSFKFWIYIFHFLLIEFWPVTCTNSLALTTTIWSPVMQIYGLCKLLQSTYLHPHPVKRTMIFCLLIPTVAETFLTEARTTECSP